MPRVDALDLTFTPEAKAEVVAFLARIRDFPPTLSLMNARASGDSEDRWTYGAYAPRNLEVVGTELEAIGHPLLYSFDGLTVAIPQFDLIPELTGKTLGLGARGLILQERPHGI